jgi:hypothetical protein
MLTKAQYFGMYLGCYMTQSLTGDRKWRLINVDLFQETSKGLYGKQTSNYSLSDCKLILRPLEDMTEEEVIKLKEITETTSGKIIYFERGTRQKYTIPKVDSSITEYLISIGIDVFNLKEKGFAVYESDLKGKN